MAEEIKTQEIMEEQSAAEPVAKETDTSDDVSVTDETVAKAVVRGRKNRRSRTVTVSNSTTETTLTESDKNKAHLIELTRSLKAKEVMTNIIEGVEILGNIVTAVFHVGPYKVYIPAEKCINIPEMEGVSKIDNASRALDRRLGSEIDFIVQNIKADEKIIFASRKEAMAKLCRHYYFKTDRNGRHRIEEGDKVEARVVATMRAGIIVEVFGVETLIRNRDLDWARIQDATQEFDNGNKIYCKVMAINKNTKNRTVELEVSRKEALPNPYIAAMNQYKIDCKYIGQVSMVDEHGVFVHMRGGVDVLCKYPERGETPQRGANVTVRITTKNPEQNRIFGVITHVGAIR